MTKPLEDEEGEPVLDAEGNPVTGPVTVRPEAAMVSLNYEGELCAVVGGLGEKEVSRGFNRGIQATRQVGSTMKPIGAYVLAVQNDKITWSTAFEDGPVRQVKDEATGEWKDWPRNFSGTYSDKPILVADALARSINTIAVRVGEKAGVGNIYRFTKNELGITSFVSADKDSGPMIPGLQHHRRHAGADGRGLQHLRQRRQLYHHPQLHQRPAGQRRGAAGAAGEDRAGGGRGTAYIMNRLLAG